MELQFRDVYTIIRKKIHILLIVIVLSMIGTFAFSYFVIKPEYETFATLIVGKLEDIDGQIDYTDLMANEKLVRTYGEIAKSKTVISEVIENLGLDKSYKALKDKINISLINDTEIMEIKVIDNNPKDAARIANEISSVLIKRINTIMNIDNIQVIDKADVPIEPFKPKIAINIGFAVVLSTMITVSMLVFQEYLNSSISAVEDIEREVKLRVIGMIPLDKNVSNISDRVNTVINSDKESNLFFEAFRMIRTNLLFLSAKKKTKIVIIASSNHSEGKSYIAANLALAFALINKKVLLIDANLRQPTIHKYYRLLNSFGISDILNGDVDFDEVVYKTGIGELDVLLSGQIPSNPSELLETGNMTTLLENVRDNYDLILLDSPPIGHVSDAFVLCTMVDGVILVCAGNETKTEELIKTKNTLLNLRANILGVILNKININGLSFSNYQWSQEKENKAKI